NPLEQLTPELNCRIFSYLSAKECRPCFEVSRNWHQFLTQKAPWGSLTLPISSHRVCSSEHLTKLTVHFSRISSSNQDQVEFALSRAPNLESVVLLIKNASRSQIRSIQPILMRLSKERWCPSLRQLIIRGGPCNLTDDGVLNLTQGCSKLSHFEFHPTSLVTNHSLVAMATNWPELRSLTMLNCLGLNLGDGSAVGIFKLLEQCRELRRLRLAIGHGIKPTFFTRLGKCAAQLTHLRMELIEGDQGFDSWGELDGLDGLSGCSNLSSLALVDCGYPGPNAFASLAAHLTGLRHLLLKYGQTEPPSASACINDQLLLAVAEHCPLLETLRLADCQSITDVGLSQLKLLSQLNRLTIRGCHGLRDPVSINNGQSHSPDADSGITTSGLASAVISCAKLSRLCVEFSMSHRLPDGDQLISRLESKCGSIVNLSLIGLTDISHASLKFVGLKFASLTRLRLGCCSRIGETARADFLRDGRPALLERDMVELLESTQC
ncbi:hypothetical protein BOX15_Mlig025769g1, partial [Macrostomum lignano]